MQILPRLGNPAAHGLQQADINRIEQAFLEEMLKYCGPTPLDGAFSGASGEEQFASFLTREHAALLAGQLDLGLGAQLGKERK